MGALLFPVVTLLFADALCAGKHKQGNQLRATTNRATTRDCPYGGVTDIEFALKNEELTRKKI